jgi:tetratricopeptide (TPR) repeat protein
MENIINNSSLELYQEMAQEFEREEITDILQQLNKLEKEELKILKVIQQLVELIQTLLAALTNSPNKNDLYAKIVRTFGELEQKLEQFEKTEKEIVQLCKDRNLPTSVSAELTTILQNIKNEEEKIKKIEKLLQKLLDSIEHKSDNKNNSNDLNLLQDIRSLLANIMLATKSA